MDETSKKMLYGRIETLLSSMNREVRGCPTHLLIYLEEAYGELIELIHTRPGRLIQDEAMRLNVNIIDCKRLIVEYNTEFAIFDQIRGQTISELEKLDFDGLQQVKLSTDKVKILAPIFAVTMGVVTTAIALSPAAALTVPFAFITGLVTLSAAALLCIKQIMYLGKNNEVKAEFAKLNSVIEKDIASGQKLKIKADQIQDLHDTINQLIKRSDYLFRGLNTLTTDGWTNLGLSHCKSVEFEITENTYWEKFESAVKMLKKKTIVPTSEISDKTLVGETIENILENMKQQREVLNEIYGHTKDTQ